MGPITRPQRYLILAAILAIVASALWYVLFSSQGVKVEFEKTSPAPPAAEDKRPVLRVAVAAMISPEATRDNYNELLHIIGDKVGRRVIFLQRRTYAEVNALIEKKEVDLAFVCSGPYVAGKDRFGLEILAVPVSHGRSVYYSYIIVNKDSTAGSLSDMRGKTFAFTDPDSNTGYLVPTYMLAQQGETPGSFFKHTLFTNSHDNSIKAVADGQVDSASVDSLIYDFLYTAGDPNAARTRILTKSSPYGIPPVVVHPALNNNLKLQLKAALLSLHQDPEARKLLDKLQIDRFQEGDPGMYDSVREMNRWLAKRRTKE